MTKITATVYYVTLTDAQRDEINSGGRWDCPVGRAYLDAKDGHLDRPDCVAMFKLAATMLADDPEAVWTSLQNGVFDGKPWTQRDGITCRTEFPRSMDVGDLILWADGRIDRCASFGFEPVHADMVPMLRHHLTTHTVEG